MRRPANRSGCPAVRARGERGRPRQATPRQPEKRSSVVSSRLKTSLSHHKRGRGINGPFRTEWPSFQKDSEREFQPKLEPMATPTDISFERGLPASIESERLILGAILLDNHAYNEAAEKLRAEDFALDSHQRIFARMADLIDAGRAVDIVTLTEELARRKEVEAVGGVAYLASLIEGLPHRLSIED